MKTPWHTRSWRMATLAALVAFSGVGVEHARAQSDNCAGATPLPIGYATPSMAGFTLDGSSACGGEFPDGWYLVTSPTDAVIVVQECSRISSPRLSLHTSCPGTAANMITCSANDSYYCGGTSRIEASIVGGRTYYLRVSGGSGVRLETFLEPPKAPGGQGPDVVSGDIPELLRYQDWDGFAAIALGSAACNPGTANIVWTNQNNSNQHPVISTSAYRLKDGVLEQLGYAWMKHGWASATETWCDYCPKSGNHPYLIPGCTDTYDVQQNGTQYILGPRWEVNPTTGFFPYPPSSPNNIVDSTSRRIRMRSDAIDPGLNHGAKYFAELHYVAADDAAAGNAMNNASYRQISFPTVSGAPIFTGQTRRTRPAILAWSDNDPTVTCVAVDTTEGGYQTRYWVASKAWERTPGHWRYAYAVFNLNSNRSAAGLVLPLLPKVQLSGATFLAPPVHTGDIYSSTPWAHTLTASQFGWACTQTHAQNPNANALRWGIMYTMVVDATTPPTPGLAKLKLFAPPTFGNPSEPAELNVTLPVPSQVYCPADFNADGAVDIFDYDEFVNCFIGGSCPPGTTADFNNDTAVDFFDYDEFVVAFETPC
ncbi:MAG: hypothetical protein AABZ53_08040 [Planctomycetota bacterium]